MKFVIKRDEDVKDSDIVMNVAGWALLLLCAIAVLFFGIVLISKMMLFVLGAYS